MATGTPSHVAAPVFHADDAEETTQYRSLSVLAIVSLVLGLASPLCFGAVLLMVIPLAGIATSILALRRIYTSDGALAGAWAAVAGLVLSSMFLVAPFTRVYVLRVVRTRQAQEFARSWIDTVRAGDTEHAFRLTIDSTRGSMPPEPGQPPPKETPYDRFVAQPIVKALVAAGPDSTVNFVTTTSYDARSFNHVYVQQRYDIVPPTTKNNAATVHLQVMVQRAKLPSEGRSRWMIWSFDDAYKPTPPTPQ
jgi:hypothetical protein